MLFNGGSHCNFSFWILFFVTPEKVEIVFKNNSKSWTMAKNKKVVPPNNQQEVAASKIEIIKNLIFGENIEIYDSEFELLKKDIQEKKRILEELIEEVRQDLKTAIDNVATDVNIRITELEDKIEDKIENLESNKVDKKMLGRLLTDLGEKVSQK